MKFASALKFLLLALSLLLFLGTTRLGCAESMHGKVVGISDGDTLTLLTSEKIQYKIRLAEIDAPEKGQPFGSKSKVILSDLVYGKSVVVNKQALDRYGRIVGRVYVESRDVSAAMVSSGAAWVFDRYVTDLSLYQLQDQAKRQGLGLWKESNPIPPWEWRSGNTKPATANSENTIAPSIDSSGCKIKGNINSKGHRIYHVPGSRDYSKTVITESKGERWFCSEEEARQAGWRKPYQ